MARTAYAYDYQRIQIGTYTGQHTEQWQTQPKELL